MYDILIEMFRKDTEVAYDVLCQKCKISRILLGAARYQLSIKLSIKVKPTLIWHTFYSYRNNELERKKIYPPHSCQALGTYRKIQ